MGVIPYPAVLGVDMKTAIRNVKKGLTDVVTFGKYKDRTVEELLEEDPDYLIWVDEHVDFFPLEQEVVDAAIENAVGRPSHWAQHGSGGQNPFWWCNEYEEPY
jgi:hypothetical protein